MGRVGARLVEAGSDASMLVVGRPTRLPGAEYLTPGWMHHAIAHAPCPVVVVPVNDD